MLEGSQVIVDRVDQSIAAVVTSGEGEQVAGTREIHFRGRPKLLEGRV